MKNSTKYILIPIVLFVLLTLGYVWISYTEVIAVMMLSFLTIVTGCLLAMYSIKILESN